MGDLNNCMRWLIYSVNLFLILLSFLLLGGSIRSLVAQGSDSWLYLLPSWLIQICLVSGAILLIIGFMGCCGAFSTTKKNKQRKNWALIVYATVMGIFFIIQIGITVAVSSYSSISKHDDLIQSQIQKLDSAIWIDIQNSFSCCGWKKGFRETSIYCNTIISTTPNATISTPNATTTTTNTTTTNTTITNTTTNYCKDHLSAKIEDYAGIFIGVSIPFLLIILLGTISSCTLLCCPNRRIKDRQYV